MLYLSTLIEKKGIAFMTIQSMMNLLQTKPMIGFLSTTGGVTLMSVTEIVTSDVTARLLSVTGACLGILVAILTVVAKSIEIRKSFKFKRNGKI